MGAIMNIQTPGSYVPGNTGALSVSSVVATTAKTIKVTFNQAPADTSKVVFTVARGTAASTTTTTWNAAKTEAILTNAANFPLGDYTVGVKADTTDLGTSKVSFTEQKIAKIAITGTKIGIVTDSKSNTQTGYATYTVTDNYGADVTKNSLGNGVSFQTGVGSITAKDGVIKVVGTSSLNLLTFTSGITISANDTNTGVSASATLSVTSQVGTLSDISLTALTNVDKKTLTAGDDSDVFYATYTALDVSGNPTTDYDLVKNGLIYSNSSDFSISTSSPYITAKIVKDPSDSKKAAIEVKATTDTVSVDTPVTINAMTWTGKNSPLSVTLKKQSTATKFTLMAPDYDIADGESKDIPFTCVDQDGTAITKYEDIVSDITFSNNVYVTRNADDTLSLKNHEVSNTSTTGTIPLVITATSKTGENSSLTINIQKTVKPDSLNVDTSVVKTNLQQASSATATDGSEQTLDFGYDNGGLQLMDQYDRAMDMTTASKYTNYKVIATSSAPGIVAVKADHTFATAGENEIKVKAFAPGSATITFNLYDTSVVDTSTPAGFKIIDTSTKTFTVVKDADIKDYGIDAVPNAIYAQYAGQNIDAATGKLKDQDSRFADYKANPGIYGKTSGGAKVALKDGQVISAAVDNSDFTVYHGFKGQNVGDIKVVANKLDASKTGSSTNLNVSIMGADGLVHALPPVAIKSTTADPIAKGLTIAYKTQLPGVTQSADIITIKSDAATLANVGLVANNYLGKYDENGIGDNGNGDRSHISSIHFEAQDQYGSSAMQIPSFTVVTDASNTGFTVDGNTGKITSVGNIVGANADVVVTASIGGYVKTVTLRFTNGGPVTPGQVDKTGLVASIATATGKVQANYTPASWTVLQTALTAATTENASTTSTTASVATAKTNLDAAIAALVNSTTTLTGVKATNIFGSTTVTTTVPDGTKVTGVSLNGAALVLGTTYSVTGNSVKAIVVTGTETVKITISGVDYTVVY
jgi:hypothetical protein